MTEKHDLTSLASSIQAVASLFRSYLADLHRNQAMSYLMLNFGMVSDKQNLCQLANSDHKHWLLGCCDDPIINHSNWR